MNDNEKLLKAKDYLDKLANGINPVTNEIVPDNDTINNIHISRCLFYVSDVLRNVLENEYGKPKKKNNRTPFSITAKQLSNYQFQSSPITITDFTKCINNLIDTDDMKELKTTSVTNWLVEKGILEFIPDENGKNHKLPTEKGIQLGISTQERLGSYSSYKVVLYDGNAQQFIIDNIDTIAYYNSQKKQ